MKVMAFNGSPKEAGNTFQALKLVLDPLEKAGIETEIIQVGSKSIRGCMACNACFKNKNEKCVISDEVNDWIAKMKNTDGILLGSPTHFSGIGATMKCFLDRAFYVSSANNSLFRHKIGASVIAVRRSGGIPAFQQLNNYLTYSEMLIPTSNYWNVIHGRAPGEIHKDEEGLQIMKILGQNMLWLLELKNKANSNIAEPSFENKTYMNFVR